MLIQAPSTGRPPKIPRAAAFRSTSPEAHHRRMAFEVVLSDETTELVDGADSFQQEGPMTTFFASDGRRGTLDCWSVKLASFRTDRIVKILRRDPPRPAALAS
jgi:hypothetical protein